MAKWARAWSRRNVQRNVVTLAIATCVAAMAVVLQVSESLAVYRGGPLHAVESAVQDAVLRSRNPERYGTSIGSDPRKVITLVAIDERSLAELGLFRGWPRTYYAQVVDQLLVAPPRVVILDTGFFEPAADDAQLIESLQRARALRPPTAIGLAAAGVGTGTRGDGALQFTDGLAPPANIASLGDVGDTIVVPDDRGVVRSMPLLVRAGSIERPTLGLIAATRYLRRPPAIDERPDPETVVLAGRRIPVDTSSMLLINYFGPPSEPATPASASSSTFRTLSFVDVMRGRADPSDWRDGIVFVGLLGAAGFADDYWTPVSDQGRKMSGVEIHANMAATLISTQFLRDGPLPLQLALIVGLVLLVALLAANLGLMAACASVLGLVGVYLLTNLVLLDQTGLQLAMATPALGAGFTFTGSTLYRVVIEQRHSRALRSALASVVPPSVAYEIARDPDRVRMGGERRLITVLFTDLKGFTSFSEEIDPELLSRVMTEYLDTMTSVVFKYGGTVDKFVGDSVMALWNAPLDDADHAQHACEAALDMQAALRGLGSRWAAEGLPSHQMRIGINTGFASVGNMGSSQRFAYTALGDAVNLAARLEPLNTEYGSWVCVSQATLDAAGGRERFVARYLDLVAVKGKVEPVSVYELLGRTCETDVVARYAPLLELYHRGIVLYQARQLAAAADAFREAQLAATDGADAPSAYYVERCLEELESPAAAGEWSPVHVMKHK